MKILARQLTLDLYNCDTTRLGGVDEIKDTLKSVVGSEPRLISEVIDEALFDYRRVRQGAYRPARL